MANSNVICLTVNGKLYEVANPEVGTTLNTWLRSGAKLTGTKAMCKEGGCGACVVMVTRPDLTTNKDMHIAANSCLFPLLSADGCYITTTEGLVAKGGQYNAIQERMAHFNATQCGYCTPGFVMTMHSLLQRNPSPTQEEIEAEFDGSICRCTGFRSIFDAMKSFAIDTGPQLKQKCADIEDLKSCWDNACIDNKGRECRKSCGRYYADGTAPMLHKGDAAWEQLLIPRNLSLKINSGIETVAWLRPDTLQLLFEEVENCASQGTTVRFVVGNTSTGVFKDDGPYGAYIDSKLIRELYEISDADDVLIVGANVSLNRLISELEARASISPSFTVIAKHMKKIANVPIRNVGSWIGNLSLKRLHPEFPSDVFTLFEAYGAKLLIHDCMTGTDAEYDLIGENGFMTLNMEGKIVLSAKIPTLKAEGTIKALSYKVMSRSQNAHAYVNAAFCATVQTGKILFPRIVFGGISKTFVHATNTEAYLHGKEIDSQEVVSGALKVLEAELKPELYSAADSSSAYRKSLSMGLFYKFYLYLCDKVTPEVASAILSIERPLTSGTQSYDSDASMYPVTEPMPKVTAIKQASGEAKYITDFSSLSDELFATIITSKIANADIENIDCSAATNLPGFHSIVTASDLPSEVTNSYIGPPFATQAILAATHVDFAGQPVAIALADSQDHVDAIAKAVTVTYKNQQPVVCEMEEAIEKGMFFDGAGDPVVIGDASTAIANAAHKVSDRITIGSQYHFYMETQVARAKPTEDGFTVECATQWQDLVQSSLSNIFGWDCNRFNLITTRIGGGYGGKGTNSLITTAVATLASYISGKPVRFHANLSQCMETYGSRAAYIADYTVGFDDNGVLQGIDIKYYSNSGASVNDSDVTTEIAQMFGDSGYYCPNWKMSFQWVKTNVASTTWCRAPVSSQLSMIMETLLEHIAKSLNAGPILVKQSNLYTQGQLNLFGEPLTYCNLREISQSLLSSVKISELQAAISAFNAANRWKKRGLAFTPIKFSIVYNGGNFLIQASIFHTDGSVVLSSAGSEFGQGLNTKMIQVASYTLGAPMDLIRVRESSVMVTPNSAPTSASVTSELCCKGVLEACRILKARLDAEKMKLKLSNGISWKDLIAKCYDKGVDFTATYWVFNKSEKMVQYNSYGAGCSEVELDIITGEFVIRKVDILYDCGRSINPELDVGQAEGAFLMGVGFFTSEKMVFDPTSGQLVTNGTWQYKPPASKDIPTVWNISFLKDAPNPLGILRSKAVGEPPLLISASVVFAIKRCIEDFKADKSYFSIDLPTTVDNIQQLCEISISDYKI